MKQPTNNGRIALKRPRRALGFVIGKARLSEAIFSLIEGAKWAQRGVQRLAVGVATVGGGGGGGVVNL